MDARERFFIANGAPLRILAADRAIRARAAVIEGFLVDSKQWSGIQTSTEHVRIGIVAKD